MRLTPSSLIVLDPSQEELGVLPWRCRTEIHIFGERISDSQKARAQERTFSVAARAGFAGRVLSLSHSQGVVVVWVLVQGERWSGGAGLDFEFLDRTLSKRAAQRICDSQEITVGPHLSPLEFWVLKESAFKTQGQRNAAGVAHAWRLIAAGGAGASNEELRLMHLENGALVAQAVFLPSRLLRGTVLQECRLALAFCASSR